MKWFLIILLGSCTPKIAPVQRYGIEVTFTSEVRGNYFIQKYNGGWKNIAEVAGIGRMIDTINYEPGLYRVKCSQDSSQIFNIK